MNSVLSIRPERTRNRHSTDGIVQDVTDESLIVRNYHSTSVALHVRFQNAAGAVAFCRTYDLAPGEVVSTPARLQRGVYRVSAHLEEGASGDTTDCLIGSAYSETAVIETGNAVVSVTDGLF